MKDFFCIRCIINVVFVFLYYSYNKKEEDFKILEEYNDYIEMIEILSKYLYIFRKIINILNIMEFEIFEGNRDSYCFWWSLNLGFLVYVFF